MSNPQKWLFQLPPVERLAEWTSHYVRESILGALRQGPAPLHIAFVMDGNRRYARNLKKEVIEGHSAGFETLARTLEVCYKIGVKVVTVYAFSIENFKRTKYEVDALMDMAKTRLTQLAEHGELLQRYGAKIQFLGNRDLVRPDVLEAIERAMRLTEGNERAILNIAAPYTSRDEMALAIRETVDEYCQPLRPRLNRPFSETHIARNIQAQRMESGGDIKPLQSFTESKELDLPQDDLALENDVIEYTPTSAPTKIAYGNFMIRMSEIMKEDTDGTISEEDLVGASNLALYSIKHGFFSEDEKQQDAIEIMNCQIKGVELQSLMELADTISDYPVDQSLVSDNTTLNTAGDQSSTTPNPQQYRDVEQINESTLTAHTYTGSKLPPVDILVRTSGVERLSDFLLWQCHQKTHIVFVKCMWPEFGLRQFIPLILEWQWRQKKEQRDSRMEWPKMD